ncbi:MAG: 1-acyl-sn-glycerol-3-phosphate acyltransferase [Bacteroidales bacterium]|nr:1-acyl-sn-glycerol-3-phosphate acyltransferase [Bacteroidales bacterium]MBN2697656.1 1-acyl-sn-glycerol-3-phosphate acyltransferase [Bacteroidales bacterium]
MKTNVVDIKDLESLSWIFRGKTGNRFAEFIMRMLAIDKVNRVYQNSINYTGAEFASRLLNDIGVHYVIGNAGRLKQLPEGAFITVSNHPYGGLDGIILIDLIAAIRPDYRFMVNKLISLVQTMESNFISVTPTTNKKRGIDAGSIHGIRETLEHIRKGHPAGFFPSGAVSDFRLRDFRISDRQWQTSILHLIHSAEVPVLPIRFFDTNSPFFYFLGLINWRIRSLRLPSEVFNKRGKSPRLGIGNLLSVREQEQFKDANEFGSFLRKTVYDMPLPDSFTPRSQLKII